MSNFKVECKSNPQHWKHQHWSSQGFWNINNHQDALDKIEHLKSVHRAKKSSKVEICLNGKLVFKK